MSVLHQVLVPATLTALALPAAGSRQLPDDDALRAGWERLSAEERVEAAEWLRFECEQLATGQQDRLRAVLATNTADPGLWPQVPDTTPHYDPEVHAPGLPIPREPLPERSSKLRVARERLLPERRPEALLASYVYDWGSRRILRAGDPEDPEVVFTNALHGHAPGTDLARALVLQALDDGEQRAALAAFAHAYTDRAGKVYPGITLFDAWRSGQKIEMPDVDALGIVHDVLDEHERWVSPIPKEQHAQLYRVIEELFVPARRYRELRETLADLYLTADPAPVGAYGALHTSLHALWVEVEDDPDALRERLPVARRTEAFLEECAELGRQRAASWARGQERQARLRQDARVLRRTLASILEQMGALDAESGSRD